MSNIKKLEQYSIQHECLCRENNKIERDLYSKYGVKAGLRDENGNGVLTGLTNISEVVAFEGEGENKKPCNGQLYYRGYSVKDLVKNDLGQRYLFEEAAYLLIFGQLPNEK